MMRPIVSQHVAARSQRPPGDLLFLQFVHKHRRLFFRLRRKHPIDRAADAEAGQFSETFAAFGTHAERRCDLFNRRIADR